MMTLRQLLAQHGTSQESVGSAYPSIAPETFDDPVNDLGEHEGCLVWQLEDTDGTTDGWYLLELSSGVSWFLAVQDLDDDSSGNQTFDGIVARMLVTTEAVK
jgi:hypothetical protein